VSLSPQVQRAVAVAFAEADQEAVIRALQQYDGEGSERVQLAILVLAQGDQNKVESLVRAANTDYRDVLLWAEYPEHCGKRNKRTKEEMAERYRSLGVQIPYALLQ
jgi:hypothetical protein